MKIFKLNSTLCLAAALGIAVTIRADDTPPHGDAGAQKEAQVQADHDKAKAEADAQAKKEAEARAKADKQAAAAEAKAEKKREQAEAKAKAEADKHAAEHPGPSSYPGQELGFEPVPAPPSHLSGDKQARLDALLARYKADQISPSEYHHQRAAILGEP